MQMHPCGAFDKGCCWLVDQVGFCTDVMDVWSWLCVPCLTAAPAALSAFVGMQSGWSMGTLHLLSQCGVL